MTATKLTVLLSLTLLVGCFEDGEVDGEVDGEDTEGPVTLESSPRDRCEAMFVRGYENCEPEITALNECVDSGLCMDDEEEFKEMSIAREQCLDDMGCLLVNCDVIATYEAIGTPSRKPCNSADTPLELDVLVSTSRALRTGDISECSELSDE